MAAAVAGGIDGGVGFVPDWDNAADDEIIDSGVPMHDVILVEVAGPLTLFVKFDDGVEGYVRFQPSSLRNMLTVLNDPDYFAQVGIARGAVSWPNEMPDLAPDAMHDEIVAHGEWILN